jgi:hypothetical protein
MLEQKWQISLFATQKEENDWANTPNQALYAVSPLSPYRASLGMLLLWAECAWLMTESPARSRTHPRNQW